MKNIGLSAKVAALVGVLLVTVIVVAVVGVAQLRDLDSRFEQLVNTTAKARQLSGDSRIELLAAVRAEKNAVLTSDKHRAVEFAAMARQALDNAKESQDAIEATIGVHSDTPEGKALTDLDRAMEDVRTNQAEVLTLAVQKSNFEAQGILFGELTQSAEELEEFVEGLASRGAPGVAGSPDPGQRGSNPEASQAAGRIALGRLHSLLFKLAQHLGSTDEQEMTRLDADVRQDLALLQEAVRRFVASLSEAERSEIASVLSVLEAIRPRVALVQQLSRTNSDARARELTMSKSVTVINRCDALFSDVRDAMKARGENEVRQVSSAARLGSSVILTTGALGTLVSIVFAALTIRSITKPVQHGVQVFEAIASGDLTRRMNLERQDEIGRLGAASDQMAAVMCGVVTQIRSVADRLGNSAGNLTGVSTDLLSQSQQMTTQAESVAAGTEQMSTNVATMATAAEEMSVNVSGISSASEEVSVNVASIVDSADATSRSVGSVAESIEQITKALVGVASDARHGSQMTQQARDMAAAATTAMRQLDQAASEINKVTEVIKSIALQTNLLALNATIEATSAGEAGKGFAVVASEVKELASQSAHSAEEIARKIEGVQSSTREAVKVIDNVAQFISQVNVSAGRISESVDGQTQTASQIVEAVAQAKHGVESIARAIAEVAKGATDVSRNTAEASHAATDVSRNAAEAAKAAETISANIHGVSESTRQNSSSAVKVNEAARLLKDLADQLQKGVSRFKVGEQPATEQHV